MAVDPRYDPAFQRGFTGDVRVPDPPAELHAGREAPSEPARYEAGRAEPEVLRRPLTLGELTRNPFVLVLSVLGTVLIIGGGAWANQALRLVEVRGGAATELEYWFLRTSTVAVPLLVVAGVLIIAGVLFVAAVAWNGRQAAR